MQIIVEILFMALVVAFLLGLGIIKKQRQDEELLRNLINKSENKVIKSFNNKSCLSKREIGEIISGTTASLFWSRKKIQINDSKMISDSVILNLINKDIIKKFSSNKYELVRKG